MIACHASAPLVVSAAATRAVVACGAGLAIALTATVASARGSFRLREAWSSEPIARLPAEARSQVVSTCRGGVAHGAFAGCYPDRIVLHYGRLQGRDRPAPWDGSGCLHLEYGLAHGGWPR